MGWKEILKHSLAQNFVQNQWFRFSRITRQRGTIAFEVFKIYCFIFLSCDAYRFCLSIACLLIRSPYRRPKYLRFWYYHSYQYFWFAQKSLALCSIYRHELSWNILYYVHFFKKNWRGIQNDTNWWKT